MTDFIDMDDGSAVNLACVAKIIRGREGLGCRVIGFNGDMLGEAMAGTVPERLMYPTAIIPAAPGYQQIIWYPPPKDGGEALHLTVPVVAWRVSVDHGAVEPLAPGDNEDVIERIPAGSYVGTILPDGRVLSVDVGACEDVAMFIREAAEAHSRIRSFKKQSAAENAYSRPSVEA